MSVTIVWSSSNGGTAITSLNHGNGANGDLMTPSEVFIRHDGLNSITDVGFYMRQYSGTYSGSATPLADFNELISWGDQATSDAFGGFQINMDAVGSYPGSAWSTYSSKSPTNGAVCRTGVGDSEAHAVELTTATGATAAGEIQVGASPNVRFKCRMQIPVDEDTIGVRQFDLALVYTYTS